MNPPNAPLPTPIEAAPAEPAAPEPLAVAAEPVPSGAPYRVSAPLPEAAEPALGIIPAPRRPRPIIGPALSVFAVVLWTFVIVGQFTTSWPLGTPLGQGTAATLLLLTTFVAWVAGILRSRAVLPPRSGVHLAARAIGIAALTFVLFTFCLVAATAAGGVSSGGHDLLIAFVLVVVSLAAAIAGPKVTSPASRERTHRQRFARVALWTAGTVLTLVAAADLAANG